MELLQMLSGSWRSHVLQLLHKISELEHIRCYPKISTLPLSEKCALAILPHRSIALISGSNPRADAWLAAFNHCDATALCTAAHDSAIVTATFVLQFPLKLLHRAAHSTATANCCIATQLLRNKQLKDPCPIIDRQVGLHLITEAPLVVALHCPPKATVLLQLCTASSVLLKSH